jgi:predicted transcriptional regulator
VDTATSIDLERATGLRQPEVSIAMRQLNPFDWIDESDEKKPGKGRPNKVYSLKVRFNDIIAHIEEQQKKAFDDGTASIKRLKELVRD